MMSEKKAAHIFAHSRINDETIFWWSILAVFLERRLIKESIISENARQLFVSLEENPIDQKMIISFFLILNRNFRSK